MKKVGLFRQLAGLPLVPQRIIAFADTYGLLFGFRAYERLLDWFEAIRLLSTTTKIFDLAYQSSSTHNRGKLQNLLPWLDADYSSSEVSEYVDVLPLGTGRCSDVPSNVSLTILQPGNTTGFLWRERFKDDIQAAALWSVREIVTLQLRSHASIDLFAPNYFSPETTGLGFAPHSLYGALWLQLALEVAEMRMRKKCQNCHRFFWLKTADYRDRQRAQKRTTKYCSDKCRVAASRERKRNQGNVEKPV